VFALYNWHQMRHRASDREWRGWQHDFNMIGAKKFRETPLAVSCGQGQLDVFAIEQGDGSVCGIRAGTRLQGVRVLMVLNGEIGSRSVDSRSRLLQAMLVHPVEGHRHQSRVPQLLVARYNRCHRRLRRRPGCTSQPVIILVRRT
jgi:hypothetical protein